MATCFPAGPTTDAYGDRNLTCTCHPLLDSETV